MYYFSQPQMITHKSTTDNMIVVNYKATFKLTSCRLKKEFRFISDVGSADLKSGLLETQVGL